MLAIAVIYGNNDGTSISMSGSDATITIPAIIVSSSIGENLITQNGNCDGKCEDTNAVHSLFEDSDGDFDNGIIAHEYGHVISTRLAGGEIIQVVLK
jgi:hypothetical protein